LQLTPFTAGNLEILMTALDELSDAIRTTATTAGPSVVGIGSRRRGTGIVIGEGRVLTNAHNLRGDEVTVWSASGSQSRGRVLGTDVDGDLAVIEVDTAGAGALAWHDGPVEVGDVVFGLAATGDGPRVTLGTVTATGRAFRGPGGAQITDSIEHSAPLAPGSSGGPLVDSAGRLVGINTNRLGDGFYLARPADEAFRARIDALGRGETVSRPRLGVAVVPSVVARRLRRSVGLPERDGLLVRGVEDGSAAGRAGIQEGDLIVEVAGQAVSDGDDLLEILLANPLPIEVKIVRGNEDRTISVGGETSAGGEA
jgi:serine protease Do